MTMSSCKGEKGQKELKVISDSDKELFERYIVPHLEVIKNLVIHYTNNYQDVDDNYQYVLSEFAKSIGTYNPEKPLNTWIHICVRRGCERQNYKASQRSKRRTGLTLEAVTVAGKGPSVLDEYSAFSLMDSLSDELYNALMQIPPHKLSPFLLQAQGLKIEEITKIEVERGHLSKYSEYTIKGRIFWTKKTLKGIMSKYGYH